MQGNAAGGGAVPAGAQGASQPPTFLQKAGSAMLSIVKHVPTRAVLWSALGFVFGLVADAGYFALGLLTLDRGAILLAEPPIVFVPFFVPFAGAALFGVHGAHRGAARAALEIETKLGLVSYVVSRVLGFVEARFGRTLANLPLDQAESMLKGAVASYLGSGDVNEGSGISGWVLKRAKRSIVGKIELYLLAGYRAEATAAGPGGGVDVGRVGERVTHELSSRMGELVMSPINKQLAIFLVLFFALGIGWFHLVLFVLSLFAR